MEDHLIHQPISELVKEIEDIRAKNEQEKPTRDGIGSGQLEIRRMRLQEINHELEQLAKKPDQE